MPTVLDFTGQTVLITGGATGLGFATAEAFGTAGATVALNDLGQERVDAACERLTERSIVCRGYAADVRDVDAIADMVEACVAELGVPDVVVANAGIYPNTKLLEITEDEWDRVIDINVKGVFFTCQAAARAMRQAGRPGRLILLSSGAANRALRGWSHYCASKAAVSMLAKAMALELGEYGIRANAILPGYIDVPEGGSHLTEEYRTAARTAIPLGRPGEPADIAHAVMLLASPLADFISGAALAVDGASGAGSMDLWPTGH
jgi:NAD(P)-dependent dehydrogenase (short-subunit alcohol dehydrogenase family)